MAKINMTAQKAALTAKTGNIFTSSMVLVLAEVIWVWIKFVVSEEGAVGGQITYGDYDYTNCDISAGGSNVAWTELSSDTYWQFKMTGVRAGDYHAGDEHWNVISDTGTSFLMGPSRDIKVIAHQLGGKWHSDYEAYQIDCEAKPGPLTLTIDGKDYPITYKNYIVPAGDGKCMLAMASMMGGGFGPSWILGDPFIRQFCNVYDMGNKRIGFASAKH